jgi:hypothetical protein
MATRCYTSIYFLQIIFKQTIVIISIKEKKKNVLNFDFAVYVQDFLSALNVLRNCSVQLYYSDYLT